MTGRRVLGGYALLVYVFLYAPILVVVAFAFNGGRDVLFWEGFSTKWFEVALSTPEIVFAIAALVFFVQAGDRLGLDNPLGWQTILIAHVVFNASVVALVVRARFVSMGQSLEEASFDLGAGPVGTFRQVTLPRLAPAILAGGLLAFTFSFDDFITSFFVTGPTSETLPIYIWGQLRFGVTPAINATAAMMLAFTLVGVVVAYLVLRRSEQGRERGGLPGV